MTRENSSGCGRSALGGVPGVVRETRGPFGAHARVDLGGREAWIASLELLSREAGVELRSLPYSLRVLLENSLRFCGGPAVGEADVLALTGLRPAGAAVGAAAGAGGPSDGGAAAVCDGPSGELAFMPSRVLLQDLTGVPCIVDLAAMRSAVARLGRDPGMIDPVVPVDLVIDHSVHVDFAGCPDAYRRNVGLEMQRNRERYELLRWAQAEFRGLQVVPPGSGIVHQVNMERLASVVHLREASGAGPGGGWGVCRPGEAWAYPDTVIGTDSHTTMVNGLGVLGWGVGGIEAEAVMLGQPYFLLPPEVVGVRLGGRLRAGVTATDLVLTLTQVLRGVGVVGAFVEYFGQGAAALSLPDRATVANMAPEYGATTGFFPIDSVTLDYLRLTDRESSRVALVERYCRLQGLLREPAAAEIEFSRVVDLDLGEVGPSMAGPRRPQDRIALTAVKPGFARELPALASAAGRRAEEVSRPSQAQVELEPGRTFTLADGAVVIAAITSCTNTANPQVMVAAGLLARNAVRRGLRPAPWVKASLAPGSRVVPGYLEAAGVLHDLEALGFYLVGFGCTTCIGNSGGLAEPIARAILENGLVATAVLSGNRNFESRIHPLVRANYLASPPLVVAYALAGTVDIDLERASLGRDPAGSPVYLRDLWPAEEELTAAVAQSVRPEMFRRGYRSLFEGDQAWQGLPVPRGSHYSWDPASTYVQEPPYLHGFELRATSPAPLRGARILAIFGDSITTDHISPAGRIARDSLAGAYLAEHGVEEADFNTFGSRRGNHEVLVRGTFGNPRLHNLLLQRESPGRGGGTEGGHGLTKHFPSFETLPYFDAAARYREEGVPLVVIAGKEYGSGSSRDWAAKGPALLGVRAVIAESFERIHRGNLLGMGVLPLQFEPGTNAQTLGLDGAEVLDLEAAGEELRPGGRTLVRIRERGEAFPVLVRLDSATDLESYRQGGILPRVLRSMLAEGC